MKKTVSIFAIVLLIVVIATIGVGCKKVTKMLYAPENIAYDGQYVTWDKVELADYYLVQINNGDKVRSNSTTYAYTSDSSFDVTVYAVSDGEEKASEAQTFRPLATITTLYVADDGAVSWDAVAGANAYSISVNGQAASTTDTHYDKLAQGSSRIKVKPVVTGDNTYYSQWSAETNVYIYNTPTTIKYDSTTLSWTGNASDYAVTINGVTESVRGNTFAYNSQNQDFSVEVKALGNHTTTYDSAAATEEFHYLDAVTEMYVVDGQLQWNAISGAEGYRIKIGGVIQRDTVQEPIYAKLTAGRSIDVAVMPYNDSGNYFSSWSADKTVYILESPITAWNNDLELDGEANNNLTWNAVNAAYGYTVRLTKDGDSEVFNYSDIQRAFAYAYTDVGVYTVEVKANAEPNSPTYYDSLYSAPITVERLAAPKAANTDFIVSDKDNLSTGFTVNYVPVNGASGYQLYKDGVLLSGKYTTSASIRDNNVADNSRMDEQNYTYIVRSMGGVKTTGGKTYATLPCLTASALSFNIKVQATPQNPTMSGFVLTWDAVAGNNGYTIAYAGTTMTANIESADLATLAAGTYSIAVNARGNGSAVLASNPSAPVTVTRLQAPRNIRITAADNGTLQWDDVSNANSYQTYLDLSETALADSAYSNMYQFIKTDGTTLSMIAVANYYNNEGTVYYMTSQHSATQQFIRLAAPTFPEGALANSIELMWNTPANINTAEYTPTYQVFSAIGEQIGGGDQNGTKFNIEYLEGGASYNFYVKAIGNDTRYLNSEYSDVITVYKLATPSMSIQDGKYVWSGVTNATSYYMEIDGKKVTDEFHVSGNVYDYTPRYTTAGEHIVKLKAIGDGRNNVDSATYTYTQVARVLQTPVISYGYSAASVMVGGTINVTITEASPHANGYKYEIAGETITSDALYYEKPVNSTGSFPVRVLALGGAFDDDKVYYVDSLYAGGTSTDVIVLLGAPSTSSFSINSDGVIKWTGISGAFGYDYQICYDGGEWSEITHTAYNTLNPINNYKQYHSIAVKVRACGNGDKTVTSAWVEFTWTNNG